MSPSNDARTCQVCGKPVEKSAAFDMCPACLGQTKERYDAPKETKGASAPKKAAISLAVVALCAVVIGVRAPAVRQAVDALRPPPPAATDPAELCLSNLWHVSSLIQENRWPADNELMCPLTKMPYKTDRTADKDPDLVVSCPNPGGHAFKSLRVSRKHPAPEAVRAAAH